MYQINLYNCEKYVIINHDRFIVDRKNKGDFFTNRESALLFVVHANMI